jgi:hypothetical protein
MGCAGGTGMWLQSTDLTDLSLKYPLLLNPNGGNVGIGTTSPTNAKLHITTTTGADFQNAIRLEKAGGYGESVIQNYYTSVSNYGFGFSIEAATRMVINNSGNVGIGTTAPGNKLTVAGSSGTIMSLSNGADADLLMNFTSGVTLLTPTTGILAFGTSSTERMRITSGGQIYINTSTGGGTPAQIETVYTGAARYGMQLKTTTVDGIALSFLRSDGAQVGYVYTTSVATLYSTTSDYRLKEDLKSINGLEIVNKIKVYDYKWKSDGSRMDGVIAHELAEILPYAVYGNKDGERMQGVDYSKIVPVMVQAIKELKAKIETLENK